jgi:N utilization substance protein A
MNSLELVESFSEFKELKSIDKQTMQHVLEDVFRAMLKKKFNTDEHIDVIVNIDKGDVQIFVNKEIVADGEVEDQNTEIAYSDAIKIEPDFEIGEEVSEEFRFNDFGRRNILSLRQNLISRILELEKDHLYKKYKERIGEIITGEVYQVWKKEIMVLDDENNELILPKSEQIPSDYFKKGESIRAVVSKVDMRNSSPVIILSRIAP